MNSLFIIDFRIIIFNTFLYLLHVCLLVFVINEKKNDFLFTLTLLFSFNDRNIIDLNIVVTHLYENYKIENYLCQKCFETKILRDCTFSTIL